MDIYRRGDGYYNLEFVDETVLISIIEGLQAQVRRYERSLRYPMFSGEEDQEFLQGHLNELLYTLEALYTKVEIQDMGQYLVFPYGTQGRMTIKP